MTNAKDRIDFWARMQSSARWRNSHNERFHDKEHNPELEIFCYKRFLKALREVEPVRSNAEKLILAELECHFDSFEDHKYTERMVSSVKDNDELMSAIFMYFEVKRLNESQLIK